MRSRCAAVAVLAVVFWSVVASAQCVRTDPWQLSPTASDVLNSIVGNPAVMAKSPVPASQILSMCNRFVSATVDGYAIFEAAYGVIAAADREVDIAFYQWEAASWGARRIGDALIAAQARRATYDPLLVRIAVHGDDVTPVYDSLNAWVWAGLDTSRVQVQIATVPRPLSGGVLHDKLVTGDSRTALVTGAQPQKHFDPTWYSGEEWHDTAYVVEGDAAQSAVANFDQVWLQNGVHWDCYAFSGCWERSSPPAQPSRWWVPSFGSQQFGDVPVLAVGRIRGGVLDNDTDSPQDVAWLRVMDRATWNINIETPNINDNAFQDAVQRAVARGVTVRLITSLGFNDFTEDLPSAGGDNMEVAGRIRQAIRSNSPWYQDRFQLRWYSRDGTEPVKGNTHFASHTKYMTADEQIAIVGSGNQDTPSWNYSHEFNFLLDDPSATSQVEGAVFQPDWARSITSYLELYEGNGGTQDVVCPIATVANKTIRFGDPLEGTDYRCDNDEARSLLLHDIPAGKSFRFYDDPGGAYQKDDWTEIITKRAVSRKYIDTFEGSFEDADVRVVFHRDNGLDGKISYAEIFSQPVGAVMDLYEGNGGTQTLVCSNRITGPRTIVLTSDAYCTNDEARSLVLTDFPTDKVIFVYDESGGSRGDDWALIVPKRRIANATIGTFQQNAETADYRICYFPDNGLDGKVSRIRIGDRSEAIGYCGVTAQSSSCPEGSCVPAQGMYVSHFAAPDCGGTESYYLPYDGYAYQCRTWDGSGVCGTTQRTVTNYSYRINGGPCQNAWPWGNTLPEFVTVYRGPSCPEGSCVPVQGMYVSHFSAPGCTGTESYYLPYDGYGYQCRSWDGNGICGTEQHTRTHYSYRINGGACQDAWPYGNTLSEFVNIYR